MVTTPALPRTSAQGDKCYGSPVGLNRTPQERRRSHSSLAETADLTLDDPDEAYQQLLARGFVVPGDPSSTLMSLLAGDERRRMPPDAPLPAADIDLVRLWIETGAPE